MTEAFETGLAALQWMDLAAGQHLDQSRAVAVRPGNRMPPATPRHVAEPTRIDHLTGRSALTMKGAGIGPVVIVGRPFSQLPPKGWQDGHVWTVSRWHWTPEDQPHDPPVYAGAKRLNLDGWEPDYGSRGLAFAVISDPAGADPTPKGTRALVAAVIACNVARTQLLDAADNPEYAAADRRGFRAEAAHLDAHAGACTGRIETTLGWVTDFEESLDPVPPFAPILIPADLRVGIGVSPTP